MKVFLDANVILDYLTDRQPFADDAEAVVDSCASENNVGKIRLLQVFSGALPLLSRL